jgi:hypothetical protein
MAANHTDPEAGNKAMGRANNKFLETSEHQSYLPGF